MLSSKKKTAIGIYWSAVEKFSVQGIQFVISIILARLLMPSDFGLIALVLIVLNILQTINEVGFGAALIHKQDRDELDFSSVFVLNIALGLFLYLVLYLLSPVLASFFEQPKLVFLIRIIGVNLIINSFVVVQRAKLLIEVDFKTQAKASFIAVVISGFIGVIAAVNDYGIMALVYQSIIGSVINVVLIWLYTGWKPAFNFSKERFTLLFNFAYRLILARLIATIFDQLYAAIIGKLFSVSQLGYYNRSQSFVALTSNNITNIIQRVSTPILCENQNDLVQMRHVLIKFIVSTALIVYPMLFGLFVLAKPLITFILTDKWLPSVLILQILCPVGLLYVISSFNKNIFNATGRTGLALKTEIYKKIFFIIIVFVSIQFGLIVLLLSQILFAILEFVIDTYFTKIQIGLSPIKQLKSLRGIIFASIMMATLVFITTYFFEKDYWKLIVGTVTGIVSYTTMCYIFDIGEARVYIKKIKTFIW